MPNKIWRTEIPNIMAEKTSKGGMERIGSGMHPCWHVPQIIRRVKGRWWFWFIYVKKRWVKVLTPLIHFHLLQLVLNKLLNHTSK